MNKKQKILTGVFLVGLTTSLFFFPWIREYGGSMYFRFSPITISPPEEFRPDYIKAVFIWFWMGAVYTGLFFILSKPR
jgi:hypothetical protein